MARPEDATPRAQRLIPLATLGALAFATALTFGRVFAGRAPTLKLIAAGLLAVAIAWATGRRGLFLATLASLVGLALALTWFVFPQTAWYGLPTLRTLRALGRSLEYVGQQTRTQVAPSPALAPLMLAAVAAVWAASSSAHTLAVRAGSPLLAIMPPVALVAFADIVLEDGVRPLYAVVFLLSALAVVFSDGLRRIRQWGPVWRGPYRDRTVSAVTGRGVRRVALVAVAAAVLVPGLLPGFRSEGLVDFSNTAGAAVRLDPFVSIHASLNRETPQEIFRVASTEGAYWRVVALDQFDGSEWRMSDPNLEDAPVYGSPALLPALYPADADVLTQRFEVLNDLGDRWVPMAYPAESLSLPDVEVRYDDSLGVAQAREPLEEGARYEVTSRRVQPTPEQLDAVTFGSAAEWGRWTFLPASLPPEVADIAREWAAGQPTPYRQVLAIQDAFDDPSFQYDKTVKPQADAQALVRFLTETRVGFCQQFSVAMAVLVRELGYPARVAIGYRPGERDGDTFTVKTDDAHSWVEVYFPGYGWLPFEPTPGQANPVGEAGTYLDPVAPEAGGAQGAPDGAEGELPGGTDGGLPPKIRGFEFGNEPVRGGGALPPGLVPSPVVAPQEDGSGYAIPYRLLVEIALLALGLLAVLVPSVKWLWRRRMLHRRGRSREAVLAAYRVFDGEAADLGMGRRDGETLLEYGLRIREAVPFSDGHLEALTAAATRAAYSAEPIAPEEAEQATRVARVAIRDMRRSAGIVRRITGVYRPGL
jgi:transglutaminase-like putative cysteine protease